MFFPKLHNAPLIDCKVEAMSFVVTNFLNRKCCFITTIISMLWSTSPLFVLEFYLTVQYSFTSAPVIHHIFIHTTVWGQADKTLAFPIMQLSLVLFLKHKLYVEKQRQKKKPSTMMSLLWLRAILPCEVCHCKYQITVNIWDNTLLLLCGLKYPTTSGVSHELFLN